MKKGNRYILSVLLLVMTILPVSSQTSIKTADLYFSGGAYYSAVNMYRSLLSSSNRNNSEIKSRRGGILFRIGECYRRMNKIEEAKRWYVQSQGAGYSDYDLYYGLGCILMQEGNYSEARLLFEQAKSRSLGNSLVDNKIISCDLHEVYEKANGQYEIKAVESLNTRGSEYGLSFYGERLIFASTGVNSSKKDISERTGLPYSDLYITSPDTRSLYGRVEKLESVSAGKANEGTFSYDMQTDQLYCTRCEANDRNCYIVRIEEKNGKFKESGKLKLGNLTYGIGHPYITDDGRRVYFTSVMEGGYGGADLWYVDRDLGGDYGIPVNLGENVNTAGDEVFPSFIEGVLYFASDGHPGLGGLDLFASYREDDGSFSKPFNMRAPFNSSWDDFNLVHRPNSNIGLFVSNRNNSESSDDIYMFDNFPPRLIIFSGQVYDTESKSPLTDYTVTVSEGGLKVYEQHVTGDAGYFLYMGPDRKYDIRVSSSEYITSTQLVSTSGVRNFAELGAETYLSRDIIEIGSADSAALMLIEMKDIFYEFDKFRLTASSKQELDKYIDYFSQYPNMTVEISSHTDSRGSNSYNMKLSELRAKTVVDYFITKGINPSRLLRKGYGEEQLLIPNARTETEHQANRRTVFKILTLGINSNMTNVSIRHISALEMLNSGGSVVDMSGWWLQVHESSNYRELELPVIKKSELLTGREVRMIRSDDGKYRYCIQYSGKSEAIRGQLSLLKENIHTIIVQF
jgi:peptidoglycan-associated lipoprotein